MKLGLLNLKILFGNVKAAIPAGMGRGIACIPGVKAVI